MIDPQFEFDRPSPNCIVCADAIRPWKSKEAHGHRFLYDQCTRCEFVFVNPRPTLASLSRFYQHYDELAGVPKDSTDYSIPSVVAPSQRKLIRQMLLLRPGPGRFLDIGSGTGIASIAAHQAGLRVTSLEIGPGGAATAKFFPGINVLPVLFEDFETPPASFDYILMSHVLEHVRDPLAFMNKASHLLAPGGLLWIFLPNFDSIYRILWGTGDPYFIPPGHLNHFNPSCLASLCRRAGLRVLQSADYHNLPRDVIAKRLPRIFRPAIEPATAVADSVACWLTGLFACGAFVSCIVRKD